MIVAKEEIQARIEKAAAKPDEGVITSKRALRHFDGEPSEETINRNGAATDFARQMAYLHDKFKNLPPRGGQALPYYPNSISGHDRWVKGGRPRETHTAFGKSVNQKGEIKE